jgi:metal-responsive CopG/Arc/MetJ family transcriptional regulator
MHTLTRQRKAATPIRPIRVTVSLPKDLHEQLSRRANRLKVSLAWVIRDAVDKYVADETPLFTSRRDDG